MTAKRIALFWDTILKPGPYDCWPWKRSPGKKGYGSFSRDGKKDGTHRIAFELWWGVDLPRWLDVCHDCPNRDNPRCCNPEHLFVSDAKGHAEDKKAKGQFCRGEAMSARMRKVAARGDKSGAQLHPERLARGDRHGTRTHPERIARGERSGAKLHPEKMIRGEQVPSAKLSNWQVITIMARWLQGVTQYALAKEYGVNFVTVHDIVTGKTWKHLFKEESL